MSQLLQQTGDPEASYWMNGASLPSYSRDTQLACACWCPTNRLHPCQLVRDRVRILGLFVPVLKVNLYGWCEHTWGVGVCTHWECWLSLAAGCTWGHEGSPLSGSPLQLVVLVKQSQYFLIFAYVLLRT